MAGSRGLQLEVDPSVPHLLLVEPSPDELLARLFRTRPTTDERLRRLRAMG